MKNRDRVAAARDADRLRVLMQSEVTQIDADAVELAQSGRRMRIRNDAVLVCAGGILPTAFLKSIGIEVETKYGTA
jgi:NADH dehydrogenase FAD-containing subunit